MRRSNKDRSEAMRAGLIEAARGLFVAKGFAETATPDIVEAAGVTRGALYHHFEDKKALFAAVAEKEAQAVGLAIEERSAPTADALQAILAGTAAFFDAMAVSGRTRILLLDGPAVLGIEAVRRLDGENAHSSLRTGLAALLEGREAAVPLEPLTDMLSAAFDRAALEIDAGAERAGYEQAIAAVIRAVAAP